MQLVSIEQESHRSTFELPRKAVPPSESQINKEKSAKYWFIKILDSQEYGQNRLKVNRLYMSSKKT